LKVSKSFQTLEEFSGILKREGYKSNEQYVIRAFYFRILYAIIKGIYMININVFW